ncbi:MAG: MYXO-CTERM sorting domain-containing protein [Sandaracinaceae bacterium]
MTDGGRSRDGGRTVDASAAHDSGATAPDGSSEPGSGRDEGCGCVTVGATPRSQAIWPLLLAAAVLGWRHRQRR